MPAIKPPQPTLLYNIGDSNRREYSEGAVKLRKAEQVLKEHREESETVRTTCSANLFQKKGLKHMSAANINVPADKVWSYYLSHRAELEEKMHLMGENKDYGTEVYVTQDDDAKTPEIIVLVDGEQILDTPVGTPEECAEVVKDIYDDYLTDSFIDTVIAENEQEEESGGYEGYDSNEEEIEMREADLEWAVRSMLETVLENSDAEGGGQIDEICEDCVDHIMEYVARKFGIELYRPMYIKYPDGVVDYEEYPYTKLQFDDEDNPIYAR